MDLSKLDVKAASEKGATLHLRNPFSNELLFDEAKAKAEGKDASEYPVTITLMGRDSPALAAKAKELEARKMKGETITDGDGSMEMLAVGVISWEGVAAPGTTKPLECNYDNALELFMAEATSWVGEQASVFAAIRRNFIGNVSSN